MNLATMIIEDVAVVTVIILFAWLVPVRQHGIPGLGGRGRDRERDARVLAELDQTWPPGYADRVAAQVRERKGRR